MTPADRPDTALRSRRAASRATAGVGDGNTARAGGTDSTARATGGNNNTAVASAPTCIALAGPGPGDTQTC
jgi:hypothetical protein